MVDLSQRRTNAAMPIKLKPNENKRIMKNIFMLSWCLALLPLLRVDALEFVPGYKENIPSKGQPERTFKLYLPPAYAKAERKLPILFVSSPGANPHIKVYKTWADQRDIIVVGIDSSKNGPSSNNIAAQDACIATLWNTDTPDNQLRAGIWFAAGMSGGAQASWLLALRYGDHFGSVLMCGQSGHEELLAAHIAVSYIHGDQEPNNPFIAMITDRLKAQKNYVSDLIVPGGHVPGTLEQQLHALNWGMNIALTQHSSLSAAEKKANAQLLLAVADGKDLTISERINVVEEFLLIPGLEKNPSVKDAHKKWQELQLEKFQAFTSPVQKFVEGTLILGDSRIGTGEQKKAITDAVSTLKKDDAIKPELKAVPFLIKLRGARGDDKIKRAELKKLYQSIIDKYTGTYVAELAAKDLAEL